MSFSQDIKRRLVTAPFECNSCGISELTGFVDFSNIARKNTIYIRNEKEYIIDRVWSILAESFDDSFGRSKNDTKTAIEGENNAKAKLEKVRNALYDATMCCKAAYVRGAFLAGGSVNDPNKNYHLEFVTKYEDSEKLLCDILEFLGIEAKTTTRGKRYVIYVKDSSTIGDLLAIIGDQSAALELYAIQVRKDITNNVTRMVNCDNANAARTVLAAQKQIAAIHKIEKECGLNALPPVLEEMARLRLKYPEENLGELAALLGIGRSGVNHRLKRIEKYAEEL